MTRSLRIVCPVTWRTPDRRADREQTMHTVAALAQLGHEVTLLTPAPNPSAALLADYFHVPSGFLVDSVRALPVGDSLVSGIGWLARLFASTRLRSYDLLFARIPALLAMGRLSPIPFLFDHYRPWPDEYPLARSVIRANVMSPAGVGLALHSRLAADSYLAAGIDPDRILVAHNGVDLATSNQRPDRSAAREALEMPLDAHVVVYAGRVNERKGLDQVLAMAEARPQVRFLLVGSEGDGPMEAAARRSPNVSVIPFQPKRELWTYLAAADVLLIPPSSDPLRRFGSCVLPIKTYTYLAAGRPILAPALPDTADILTHDRNAWLVPPDDHQAAVTELDRLLQDRPLAERLALKAEDDAAGLTWDARARNIEAFVLRRLGQS